MQYPFMFVLPTHEERASGSNPNTPRKVVVKISNYDLTSYNSSWMGDEEFGDWVYVPDVDLAEERHEFDDEFQALEFIRQWWAKQPPISEPEG